MANERQVGPAGVAAWVGGGLLVALGQLALPFASMELFRGGGAVTPGDLPPSFTLGSGEAMLRRAANRLAELWFGPASVAVTVLVVALVALVLAGRAPRALPALAAWFAAAWQVGSYLAFATSVDFVRTPRPGLGLVASAAGAALLTAAPLVAARVARPADPTSDPAIPPSPARA